MNIKPTNEQLHILDLVANSDNNLIINSLAGTGKTTVLELIAGVSKTRPILYLAFNKSIVKEAKAERNFPDDVEIRTFNGMGQKIWGQSCAERVVPDKDKIKTILQDLIRSMEGRDLQRACWDVYYDVMDAVAMAKALGYIPPNKYPNARRLINQEDFYGTIETHLSPLAQDLCDATLNESIRLAYKGCIDFNDQIYMPALFGASFPRFPLVIVDELQDLSPTNHALLHKLCRGRFIGVGDPWQNIYGFRGAKQGGMQELKEKFKCEEATLSISFRCPRAIVELAQWRVPHFKWMKQGGSVYELRNPTAEGISEKSAILCRNNAPIFRLAFNLLSSGRSVSVAGSDVGPKLVGLLKRLGDSSMARSAVFIAISQWEEVRVNKGQNSCRDMAECMRVFANHGNTLGQAIAYAEHLFKQSGSIRLLTGHKAKGLEFDHVYHLDPWIIGDHEQDLNLRYVIQTRSANIYTEMKSEDFQWH